MAPGALNHMPASQHSDGVFGPSQGSQQPFSGSQEPHHAGRPSSSHPTAPYTAVRPSNALYSSATAGNAARMTLSAGRNDAAFLRSGGAAGPTPGTVGRGSLSVSRRKSAPGQPVVGGSLLPTPRTFKDPRIKDKRTLAVWQNDLFEFLKLRNYTESLSQKTLQTPTTKDFQNIFRFIYTCADPTHKWGQGGKKFEDEVIPLLKNLGYPCVDTLSKSGLQAPGSMHTWPTMLAMLHWMYMMMEVRAVLSTPLIRLTQLFSQARVQAFEAHPPLHLNPEIEVTPGDDVAETMASVAHWFEYVGDAYPAFLESDDYDFEPQKLRLENRFRA